MRDLIGLDLRLIGINQVFYNFQAHAIRLISMPIIMLSVSFTSLYGQITIDPGNTLPLTADNIIQNVFLGEGVDILDVTFIGESGAVGVFENGLNNIGLDRGIVMTTGSVEDIPKLSSELANEDSSQETLTDEDLESLLVNNISLIDIAKYEITFMPAADTLKFRYVFASEEYPEFVCSSTNDVFGFFISGPNPNGGNYNNKNIALVPDPADPGMGTFLDIPVSVNNVNGGMPGPQYDADPYCLPPLGSLDYAIYYNEVAPDKAPIYNGYLDIFEAKAHVVPCQTYTIKMAIADGRLGDFDSAVFLEEKSFRTNKLLINVNNPGVDGGISEGCKPGSIEISLTGPATADLPIQLDVLMDIDPQNSAEENIDFVMVDRDIFIPKGSTTVMLELAPIQDNLDEDTEYIHLQIRTDICNVDTIVIPLFDNSLNQIEVIDSVFTCEGQGQQVMIENDENIEFTSGQNFVSTEMYTNTSGDSIIKSPIMVSGIEKEMLEKNMIGQICIDTLIHQRLNDLDIYLEAPSGQLLELSTDNGARPDNDDQMDTLINTCFTLFASKNINLGNRIEGTMDLSNPNYTGLYLPEGSMNEWLFPFESTSNGEYNLVIFDDQGAEFPTELRGWHIFFRPTYQIFYSWSPRENINCWNCADIGLRPDTSEYYYLEMRDSYGCTKTDSIWVEAYPRPDRPEVRCDSSGTSDLLISWDDIPDAISYQFRINEMFPWINGLNQTPRLVNGIEIHKGTENEIHMNGFLPEEEVSFIFLAVNSFGCISEFDTLVCKTNPCPQVNPAVDSILIDQPICDEDGNTTVQLFVTDFDQPLNYRLILEDGHTLENNSGYFDDVPQGNWAIRVIDTLGCSIEDTIRVDDPLPVTIIPDIDKISCTDANDAGIVLNVENAFGSVNYAWSTGDNTNALDALSPGMYTVTVTDQLGCSQESTIEIGNPEALMYLASLVDTLNCAGTNDASTQLNINGGEAPYDVLWENQQTGLTATTANLGYLSYTISDARGCIKTDSIEIIQDEGFEIIIDTQSTLTCYTDSSATAQLTITSLATPFDILWDNGETTENPIGLHAGLNSVTITDSEGCIEMAILDIDAPLPIQYTLQETLPSCHGFDDGEIMLDITGGISQSGGYTIEWENGQSGNIQSNIPAGIYCATIIDDNECELQSCIELEDQEILSIDEDITNVNCADENDGSILISPSGGSGEYEYTWDGPDGYNAVDQHIDNLGPGNYQLTISDINADGCFQVFDFTIDQESDLEAALTIEQNISCFEGSDGVLLTEVFGGVPPFQYSWSTNVITKEDSIARALPIGNYMVTVTDGEGCEAESTIILEQPEAMNIAFEINEVACMADSSGVIRTMVSGGTPPYQYFWPYDGSSSSILDQVPSGIYSIQVTDHNNCAFQDSVQLDEPEDGIELDFIISQVSCHEGRDGSIEIIILQGVSPLMFSLDNSSYSASTTFENLSPGIYKINAIDGKQCLRSYEVMLGEPDAMLLDAGGDQLVEYGGSVQLNARVINPNGPIEWQWTSTKIDDFDCPIGCPDPIVSNITKSFSAKVYARDTDGCEESDFVSITVFEEQSIFVPTGFTPNGDNNNDVLKIHGDPAIFITVFNIYSKWGELVYSASDFFVNDPSIFWSGNFKAELANQGTYTWTVEYRMPSGKVGYNSGQTSLIR